MLDAEERMEISVLSRHGGSIRSIARATGRNSSGSKWSVESLLELSGDGLQQTSDQGDARSGDSSTFHLGKRIEKTGIVVTIKGRLAR
jgi:hypothetical protein